ncbi:YciI family protein [Nonomuraea sp. NPDC048916]|uniref:YciI family protein n=1 Tax=Nonomuraea sp. NPDC048916 TaxID=3154232 RepID=UPI0033ECE0F6
MRYVLMLCGDASAGGVQDDTAIPGCGGWGEEMRSRGVLAGSTGLRPPADATTLRVRSGEVPLTDGPFAETKDQMGGFSVIDCANLDEAIEIAAKRPWAKVGKIEIRPVWKPVLFKNDAPGGGVEDT